VSSLSTDAVVELQAADPTNTSRRPTPRWWVAVFAVLCALVAAPVVAAGVTALSYRWMPAGDWGILELRVTDVGNAHTPLVGPYSRFGWNHPGPLLFWVLAVPYRLLGGSPTALLLGAAAINAGAVTGMLVFAWRHGRMALLAPTAAAMAIVVHSIGGELLRNPWNPWVTVLPFGLLVLAAWAATEGDTAALYVTVLVGAFEAQSHIGFAAVVVVLTAGASAGWWWRRRQSRPLVVAAVILLACWTPVVIDALTGQGNVGEILSFFAGGAESAGPSDAFGLVARELAWGGPWRGALEPIISDGSVEGSAVSTLIAPVAAMAATALVEWFAGARQAVRLQAFVAATTVVGIVSVSRISGSRYDYLVRWLWPLAGLWWASIGFAVISVGRLAWGRRRGRRVLRRIVAAATVVLVATVGFSTITETTDAVPVGDWTPALSVVSGPTEDALAGKGPVLLASAGPLAGWAADGLAARLSADGTEVMVPREGINLNKFGELRLAGDELPSITVLVATGSAIDDATAEVEAVEIVSFDPLTPEERADANELERRIRSAARFQGETDVIRRLDDWEPVGAGTQLAGVTADTIARLDGLRAPGVPGTIFELTAPDGAPLSEAP
jgi:hypothetical protein